MVDQSRRLSEPLRWGRREGRSRGGCSRAWLLAALGLGAYALTSGAPARRDCIEVTFASTLGGATDARLRRASQAVCASPGAFRGIADGVRAACRRAGFPFDRLRRAHRVPTRRPRGSPTRRLPRAGVYTNVESRLPSVGHGVPTGAPARRIS